MQLRFYRTSKLLPSSRHSNDLINKLQERAPSIVYKDFNSSFYEHLEMAKGSTIQIRSFFSLKLQLFN